MEVKNACLHVFYRQKVINTFLHSFFPLSIHENTEKHTDKKKKDFKFSCSSRLPYHQQQHSPQQKQPHHHHSHHDHHQYHNMHYIASEHFVFSMNLPTLLSCSHVKISWLHEQSNITCGYVHMFIFGHVCM